jgi:hypothetical protein
MVKKAADDVAAKSLGLAVLFGSFPFSRIFTVLLKGGDEYLIMRNLFNNGAHDNLLWLITALIIIGICILPMIVGWKALPEKKRWLSYSILVIGPLFIVLIVLLAGLNPLLHSGFMDAPGLLGAPLLVNLWLAVCISIIIIFRKSLQSWLIMK